ncbi:NADH-quinone oxidoreductase subunit NuoN [Candidatus Tisiphia endosymbiont of Beris chalybata]|uniref:NADH-quinone oxidoreductase subunit NuoN n=1 Tax=Candidatus Tisiphia endosymbiont of Beris chalybata TaxID=3066262 RepID=UPI00312CA48C
MLNSIFGQFVVILPEISLVLLALFSQLSALFFSNRIKIITNITVIILFILLAYTFCGLTDWMVSFNNSFATGRGIGIYKAIVLLFSIMTIVIYKDYCQIAQQEFKFEFITLILLSTMSSFAAISSRNFLLLFCSLELQALISYVLAGFSINNLKSSEGALKYFVLGALISCLSLFGISYIYGFGGGLDYTYIFDAMRGMRQPNIGLVVGMVLFLSSIFFKLSVVPLHVWTPDVYEGSPIPAVTYFSASTKFANLVVLLNIIILAENYKPISMSLIKILAILSMFIGAGGALRQNSLKRLMGYSTILNIGYVLIGVSLAGNSWSSKAALLYMIIYAISVIGFFSCLIALLGDKADTATFEDLQGLASTRKALAGGITIIMFSLIGIPPLAGFFGKYFLFYQAIIHQQFTLAIIGIGSSVVAAYYYLKIVKSMYFVEIKQGHAYSSITSSLSLKFMNCLVIAFLLLFSVVFIFAILT